VGCLFTPSNYRTGTDILDPSDFLFSGLSVFCLQFADRRAGPLHSHQQEHQPTHHHITQTIDQNNTSITMKGFLDKLQKNKGKNEFKNPFAPKQNLNRGGGKSLGGSKPGKLIPISITGSGSIGVGLENTNEGSAIIASVDVGSLAAVAGLQRGDVVCFADTNGADEIKYRHFLDMAKSNERPLIFEVRRVQSAAGSASASASATSNGIGGGRPKRAEDDARKQAVIAAAEARDKKNKDKNKPIRKGASELSTVDRQRIEQQKEELAKKNVTYMSKEPLSDESRKAVEAAKMDEVAHAAKLGYNPYETMKGTGQQGSTAAAAITHGAVNAGGNKEGDTKSEKKASSILPPGPIDPSFDDAFTTLVTTNNNDNELANSLRIMRKLTENATKDGQTDDKRRVRISNPNKHIQAAINDMNGALDVMTSVGFIMTENEEDSEIYLIFPPGDDKPVWLSKALDRLEQYENNL